MDLSQGICILCTNNTKIIVPPQAENTTSLLKDILADQIDEKFDKVNVSLKVCPGCLHDLITVADLKQNIKKDFSKDRDNCTLCYSDQHLVSITNFPTFDQALENITSEKIHGKRSACLNCIKCLDLLERIKTNLFKKYPHLKHTHIVAKEDKKFKKSLTKNNPETYENVQRNKHSSKAKHSSDEEPEYFPQSKRQNVDNPKAALKHLKPLKNTRFATDKFKEDNKLLKQIAFVKLSISSLSTKNYKKLSGKSDGSEKSNNLSDTDSSRDSPSSKQSFFKIKLKVKSNKMKSQRVTHGKVTKLKTHNSKHLSESQKELIVRIMRMNLDGDQDCQQSVEITTPTKASRKMMPDDSFSSSKKRKSVTFADVLDSDITDVSSRKDNVDSTPLKSLLKKNDSPKPGLLKNGDGGSSDESDNGINKQAERNLESEEELETTKSYVDDILKNNDDIFDSLRTSQDTVPAKITKNSFGVNSSSSDSDDQEINRSDDKIKNKKPNGIEEREKSKSEDVNNSNSGNEEDTAMNEEEKSNNKEENKTEKKSTEFRKKIRGNSSDSDVNEKRESEGEETQSDTKNNEKEEIIEIVEKEFDSGNKLKDNEEVRNIDDPEITTKSTSKLNNKNDEKIHLHRSKKSKKSRSKDTQIHKKSKKLNSIGDSILEENPINKDDDIEDLPENDAGVVSSAEQSGGKISDVDHEISLSKCLRDKNGDDQSGSGTSMDDQEVTLEEFKKLKKSNSVEDTGIEEIDGKNNLHEDITCDTVLDNAEGANDKDANGDQEDECQQNDKQISDSEFDSDTTNKKDTSESSSKYKKRSRSKIDKEALNLNKDIEDSDGPETKKKKVSDVDDLSNTDSEEDTIATKTNEDTILGVPEIRKDVPTSDDKIDKLIAQYTNPSSPQLNNDNNVSDSEEGDDDQGSRYQVSSKESEEAVDLDTNVVMVKSTEIVAKNVAVEHSSESDIIDNGVPDASSVTLEGLDLDNIIDSTVDSC